MNIKNNLLYQPFVNLINNVIKVISVSPEKTIHLFASTSDIPTLLEIINTTQFIDRIFVHHHDRYFSYKKITNENNENKNFISLFIYDETNPNWIQDKVRSDSRDDKSMPI